MTVEQVISEVTKLCEKNKVQSAFLFGSRAKGSHTDRSDIDIAVSGTNDFGKLVDEVEEIDTLYKVDLVNLDTCKNEALLEDIRIYGKKIL